MSEKRIRENRWTVDVVRCLDCDHEFRGAPVSYDVGRPPGDGARVLMLFVPETCPNCHNLTVAPSDAEMVEVVEGPPTPAPLKATMDAQRDHYFPHTIVHARERTAYEWGWRDALEGET